MKRSGCRPFRFAGWPTALLVLALLGLPLPRLTAQQPSNSLSSGSHLFRNILHELDLKPLDASQLYNDPEHTILIVLGQPTGLRRIPDGPSHGLPMFLNRGGAVLLATDNQLYLDNPQLTIHVDGGLVRVKKGLGFDYKDSDDCIFVEATDPKHPIFQGLHLRDHLTEIATNRASFIFQRQEHEPRWLPVLATFPPDCTYAGRPQRGNSYAFAMGGDVAGGRLLVLSDHSVFINAMLWQTDNDNTDFTYNIAKWLKDGKRTHVLFVEDGEIRDTFDIPMQQPPLPPLERLVDAFDNGLVNMEEENWFNETLGGVAERLNSPRLVNALLMLLTIILGAYGLIRLGLARHQFEPRVPLLTAGLAQLLPRVGILDQRHRQMLRDANFWETARALAQQSWETALGAAAPVGTEATAPGSLPRPPLRVRGWRWEHWRLRRQVWRLWRLAYGNQPQRITPRKLTRLGNEMKVIEAALADGTLQITTGQSPKIGS